MSYSISVRLRRVIFEEAIRLGASVDTWQLEEHQITVHPIQKAPGD
jgi:hypothetical protein